MISEEEFPFKLEDYLCDYQFNEFAIYLSKLKREPDKTISYDDFNAMVRKKFHDGKCMIAYVHPDMITRMIHKLSDAKLIKVKKENNKHHKCTSNFVLEECSMKLHLLTEGRNKGLDFGYLP